MKVRKAKLFLDEKALEFEGSFLPLRNFFYKNKLKQSLLSVQKSIFFLMQIKQGFKSKKNYKMYLIKN